MEKYLNPALSPKERAEDLLSKMSLEEKMRQLGTTLVISMIPNEYQDLRGGIGSAMIMTGDNLAEAVRKTQDYVMDNSPHRIPVLVHAEALTGPVCCVGGNQYPMSVGLGASFEPELVEQMCEATREQMVANGVRHALSPVGDLARDLRWGRCNETYGNDPTLSAVMMTSFVKALQGDLKNGVAATGKHFLGYSQTEGGLNCHMTMVNDQDLREQYAKPFEAAINLADLKTIMPSYASINGHPVSGSKEIMRDLLREDLGFKGVTFSDYGAVSQLMDPYKVAEVPKEAGMQCLKAGMDIEAPARVGYGPELQQAVKNGEIDITYVNEAVLRVLTLKFELGLFENPYPHEEDLARVMDNTRNNANSYVAAQKTMTLLKNDGLLPLEDSKKKIAVVGPTANCLRMMFSNYTAVSQMEMLANLATEGDTQQGYNLGELIAENSDENKSMMDILAETTVTSEAPEITDKYAADPIVRQLYPGCKTIFEGLQGYFEDVSFAEGCDYKGDDRSGMEEAIRLAKDADVVICCVGGKNGLGNSASTGEGVDASSLDLLGLQEELMRACYAVNPNMVIVHTDCRPLVSEWVYENAPAILEAWLPMAYGGNAIADVLTGKYNPAGRTPIDVPRSAGHLPVYHYQRNGSSALRSNEIVKTKYVNGPSSVLAPFGYGLSYTEFEYSDLQLRADDSHDINISVAVKNIGERMGDEVVQLYGEDLVASMIRPVHELVGFKRITLMPGETKTVEFSFNIDVLSFCKADGKWIAEKGDFRFYVGGHSDDVALCTTYHLEESIDVNPNKRTFYASATVE